MADALQSGLSREQAFDLLKTYNEDPFHIAHGETLEGLMRYYAQREDPTNVDFWGQVGLLHDLDWEKWQDEKLHTVKTAELLVSCGIRAIWNFAHVDLSVPEGVLVENVHLSDSLMKLSYNCNRRDNYGKG